MIIMFIVQAIISTFPKTFSTTDSIIVVCFSTLYREAANYFTEVINIKNIIYSCKGRYAITMSRNGQNRAESILFL